MPVEFRKPVPAMMPPIVKRQPVEPKVPPLAPSVMPRLALSVKTAELDKVPPFITSLPAVALPGTTPRLASASMLSVPALMVVMPL